MASFWHHEKHALKAHSDVENVEENNINVEN